MKETLIYAVGDVLPDRPDPHQCFALVRDRLREADVAFCQLEGAITLGGTRLPQARHAVRGAPAIAPALKDAGFDVVSFASNHCMDWGAEALLETIEALGREGINVVGAGANIAEARKPAMIESNGSRLAFLAYCSILPQNYWAETNRAGCAPMRAFTLYEQIEHDQPGTPARVHTYPHRDDLAALKKDIADARANADFVAVSLHWGIHFVPAVLADYQRDVAHAAIDAGADVILGHHAHILKGVEIYQGKPIFYSLCNFAVDLRMDKAHAESKSFKEIQALSPDWVVDFDSLYNFPPDARMSVVVKLRVKGGKLEAVSLLPVFVNKQAQPQILDPDDPNFSRVRDYLTQVTERAGLNARFLAAGAELIVS